MAQRDLYRILGVAKGASEKDIRRAYRDLARKYHPDRNPDDKTAEERFKEVSYAKEVLLNKEKRRLYDEFGEQGLREGFDADAYRAQSRVRGGDFTSLEDLLRGARAGGGFSGGYAAGGQPAGGGFQDFFGSDVVDSLFGRGRRRRGPESKGPEVVAQVSLDFGEAIRGVERELSLRDGSGAARALKVRIPAGVRDGGKVRLRGQAPDGGDVVLQVQVKPHPHFERDDNNLRLTLPVTVGEAFHGTKVEVPTPEGTVSLRIPPGVKGGGTLRLRGKGVKRGNEVGDLLVRIQIVLPESDDAAVKEAVDSLERGYRSPVRPKLTL